MISKHKNILSIGLALALLLGCIAFAPPASAQSFTAASEAELRAHLGACAPGDTIELGASFALSDPIAINKQITLDGKGFELTLASANTGRHFITAASATIKNITLTGHLDDQLAGGPGGGVQVNSGTLSLVGATVRRCNTDYRGGGVYGVYGLGGSPMILENCSILENKAMLGGGIFGASTTTVTDCTISGNQSTGEPGGAAIVSQQHLLLQSSALFDNSSNLRGGALAIASGTFSIIGCSFSANTADSNGGALFLNSSTSGSIANCRFERNQAGVSGGAMYLSPGVVATLTNCAFTNNRAGRSGGVAFVAGTADLTVQTRCSFTDNTALLYGGAIFLNSYTTDSLALAADTTFADNMASEAYDHAERIVAASYSAGFENALNGLDIDYGTSGAPVALVSITFDPNGGESAISSITVRSGAVIAAPAATRAGHALLGWANAAADVFWDFADPVVGDMALKAMWQQDALSLPETGDASAPLDSALLLAALGAAAALAAALAKRRSA